MNYCSDLFNTSEEKLAKTAIIDPENGTKIRYDELQKRVKTTAQFLLNSGVGKGDSVINHLYNSITAAVTHMAVQYIGAVSCLIDPLTQTKSLPYYVDDTKATLIISSQREESLSDVLGTEIHIIGEAEIEEASLREIDSNPKLHQWDSSSTNVIYYTSGTTSTPKGVPLTLGNHDNFTKITQKYWQPVDENSTHICYVPLSHGFGSIFLLPLAIQTSGTLVIMRSFHPGKVVDAIEQHGVTHIYGVPSHYQQLLRFKNYHDSLKKLKMAFCAAAKLDYSTMEEWKAVTGFHLDEGYGLIETTGGVVWRVGDEPQGTGHMGICPDPSLIEIGILDPNGIQLAPGKEGEIAVKGASVTKGYLNKEEENARVFVDGWFKTGDKGYISEDNQLFMTGRIKDIINIAGIKISPYEVEAVLNDHPEVKQSIVVATEDALYGEVVKAFVLPHCEKLSERDLIKYAQNHLINFQVPKVVEFLSAFPTNNMGKIDRKALRVM